MLLLACLTSFSSIVTANATTYDIGPGQPIGTLAGVNWGSLKPGDVVNIHYKPGGYHEIIQVSQPGTAAQPIIIRGIPDATGALPILDGNGAVMDPNVNFRSSVFEDQGVIIVSPRATGYVYGTTFPAYITIESLDIRNALYKADASISFTDQHGTNRLFNHFACGIYIEFAQHLIIRGCEISFNGNGIFANSKNMAAQSSSDLLIEKNYLHDNGQPAIPGQSNGFAEHNIYVESVGAIYQYNRFGPLRPGCHGTMIKNRSSGTIIRYNEVVSTETSDIFAILDPQGGSGYIDQMPDYPDAFVYGNSITLQNAPSGGENLVWFAAVNGAAYYPTQHRGTLYFYNNTIVNHQPVVSAFSVTDSVYTPTTNIFEKVDCRNNIFYTDSSVQSSIYNAFHFIISPANGTLDLGVNWVSPGTLKTWTGHAFGGVINGWSNLIVGSTNGLNNPMFVDITNSNYRLLTGANALDAAGPLASNAFGFDVTNEYFYPSSSAPRVTLGNGPDLGAFESSGLAPAPGPGKVQFSSATYSVTESSGSISLVVQRVNGTNGAISVDFVTGDVTAISPGDYSSSTGTLSWAAGDAAPKVITLHIADDALLESNETFQVTLFNALGGSALGAFASASVTILDDDAPAPLPNRRPIALPQSIGTTLNTSIPVTLAGHDGDGDPLTFNLTTPPSKGTLTGSAPNFVFKPTTNASGPDVFYFTVSDGKTSSVPAIVNVVINSASNAAPVVSLITPVMNALFVAPTNLLLTAIASDSDGIARIDFYEGTNKLNTSSNAPYTCTWTNVSPGSYTVVAKAFDTTGNRSYSAPAMIQILAVPPILSSIVASNGMIEVFWPLSIIGANLEESADLSLWNLATNKVVDTATQHAIFIAPTNRHFYRLGLW